MPFGVLGAMVNTIGTLASNEMAEQREAEARAENYKYGEMAADSADARTRALYNDLQSPQALLQQYQQAGLSPSLMFAKGGAGGGATPAKGAQGTGPAGVSPNVFGLEMMQGAQIGAQIQQMQALTEKTKAETETINEMRDPSIKNILAEAGLKEASEKYTAAQTFLANVQGEIANATTEEQKSAIRSNAKIAEENAKSAFYEALQNGLNYDFLNATQQERIEAGNMQVEQILGDILQTYANIRLTNEQSQAVQASVHQNWMHITSEFQRNEIYAKSIDAQKAFWEGSINNAINSIENDTERVGIQKWGLGKDIFTSLFSAYIFGKALSGSKPITFKGFTGGTGKPSFWQKTKGFLKGAGTKLFNNRLVAPIVMPPSVYGVYDFQRDYGNYGNGEM